VSRTCNGGKPVAGLGHLAASKILAEGNLAAGLSLSQSPLTRLCIDSIVAVLPPGYDL